MTIFTDLSVDELVKHAVVKKEGVLAANRALQVETGAYTGRAPKNRFIVEEPATKQDIDWGVVNQPISADKFEKIMAACQ